MKKNKKIILMAILCAVAVIIVIIVCVLKNKDNSLSAVGSIYESDDAGLVETENLIYYVSDILGGFLNVYDKNTKVSSLLCNRPDCKHNTQDCVAAVFEPRMCMNTLCSYNNNLYYVDYDISAANRVALYKVSMDGSSRDNVLTVYEFPEGDDISLQDINVSKNGENLYLHTAECYDGEDPLNKRTIIYQINLKNESIRKLTEDDKYGGYINICGFNSDYIYYSIVYFSKDLKNMYGSIYSYNIKNDEKKVLADEIKSVSTLCTLDNYIYYNLYQGNVFRYDINTGETEEVIKFENPENMSGRLYSDDTYIYYYNFNADYNDNADTYLYAYDKKGELKAAIKTLPSTDSIIKVYKIKDKLIFGVCSMSDDTEMRYSFIDKNDIKNDELEWKDLFKEN